MAATKTKTKAKTNGVRQLRLDGESNVKSELVIGEAERLVSRAAVLDGVSKLIAKELKEIKAQLIKFAKQEHLKKIEGSSGDMDILASSSTNINVSEFIRVLKSLDKLSMVDDLLSVKVGDAKKFLGEDVLKEVMHTEHDAYGKIKFKTSEKSKLETARKKLEEVLD